MNEDRVNAIEYAGTLHDVGKLGVPTGVLQKAGKLTDDEFDAIKTHPVRGHEIVRDIEFLDEALTGIFHHHERMDGRGYPAGLSGDRDPRVRPRHRRRRRVRLDDLDPVLPRRASGRRGGRGARALQGHAVRPGHGRRDGPRRRPRTAGTPPCRPTADEIAAQTSFAIDDDDPFVDMRSQVAPVTAAPTGRRPSRHGRGPRHRRAASSPLVVDHRDHQQRRLAADGRARVRGLHRARRVRPRHAARATARPRRSAPPPPWRTRCSPSSAARSSTPAPTRSSRSPRWPRSSACCRTSIAGRSPRIDVLSRACIIVVDRPAQSLFRNGMHARRSSTASRRGSSRSSWSSLAAIAGLVDVTLATARARRHAPARRTRARSATSSRPRRASVPPSAPPAS